MKPTYINQIDMSAEYLMKARVWKLFDGEKRFENSSRSASPKVRDDFEHLNAEARFGQEPTKLGKDSPGLGSCFTIISAARPLIQMNQLSYYSPKGGFSMDEGHIALDSEHVPKLFASWGLLTTALTTVVLVKN